jgi:two-component system sensor histidine kinase RegB
MMPENAVTVSRDNQRSRWIKLRTTILLRWVAILGQSAAVLVAVQFYSLRLELDLIIFAIGISVAGNLVAMFVFPKNERLSEKQNMAMILFDLVQLLLLLSFTGGLNNPFAVLVIAPVAISATSLPVKYTLCLGVTAIVAVTLLANYNYPLLTEQGFVLRVPNIFVFGNWTAIVISMLFLSFYTRKVTVEVNDMSDALFATQMALSREQKLTDLGGVVAAAAHELGTPLATIKLASSELMDELKDRKELLEDAVLIRDQADRCRDILQSMGQAGKDDQHMRNAPASEVIREAAEPHLDRGVEIIFEINLKSKEDISHPVIQRRPEIIHGLRNMIQNAIDFADSKVWIVLSWSEADIKITINDDGPGFPVQMISRIGDPFVSYRKPSSGRGKQPEYEGMGLGLFIAKTLLERTNAKLNFSNGAIKPNVGAETADRMGAIVEIFWLRADIEKKNNFSGENENLQVF